jgi:hypothetical protein
MRNLFISCLMLVACGKGGGGGDDWTTHPVKTVSATSKGVAFTIDLPDGMRQKPDGDRVEFDFLVGEYTKTPNFTISVGGFAKTIDDYVKTEPKVDNWLRKEALPDGGYIASYENSAYKGKEDYLVYVYRPVGDKVLTCHARVTPWERGASVKDKVPLVEKACLSMKGAK